MSTEKVSAERLQLVILLIADQLFAIRSEYFREVVRGASVTPIPFVPPYIEGLVNLDGKIATQIDLGRVVTNNEQVSTGKELAFIDTGRSLCALRVQQVVSILDAATLDIKRFEHEQTQAQSRCVSGQFVHDGRNVLLLDHQAIGRLVQARDVAAGAGGLAGKVRIHNDSELSSTHHYLVVYAGKERFGFAINSITELVKSGGCTPIPGAPKPVSGLTLVRGQPVLTAGLQTLLDSHSATATDNEWIVLVEQDSLCVGFAVDSIAGIEEYEQAMIIPVSHPDSSIRGVVENSSGELTMIVDPANILSGETASLLRCYAPSIRQSQNRDLAESTACLSVMIHGELFAIPLEIVNRVIEYKPLESLNDTDHAVLGAIDVDGRVVPVVRVHNRLPAASDKWTEYVIVEKDQSEYAIRVNRTDQVIHVPLKNISRSKNTANPFVAAVVQYDSAIYSIFNNEQLNHIHSI